jgi:hypothetical protein
MCIKDYETKIGDQGPVRAVELLMNMITWYMDYMSLCSAHLSISDYMLQEYLTDQTNANKRNITVELKNYCRPLVMIL